MYRIKNGEITLVSEIQNVAEKMVREGKDSTRIGIVLSE